MPGEPTMPGGRILRSNDLIGRPVRDRDGNRLGRVADIVLDSGDIGSGDIGSGGVGSGGVGSGGVDSAGVPGSRAPARVVAVLVTDGPWGRLLGYVSPDDNGPWLLDALARRIIHRHVRTYRWDEIVLDADS